MSTYAAVVSYRTEIEHHVHVRSDKCSYQVLIDKDVVRLVGPGVGEVADTDFPEFDSAEDLAIYIVLLFENGLWP